MLGIRIRNKKLRVSLTIVLVLSLLWSSTSLLVVKFVFDGNFARSEKPEYTRYLSFEDTKGKYERRPVTFKSGKHTLKGYIYGEKNNKGLIVMSHGLGMGAQTYLNISLYFVDRGWRVLAYDNTGSYESEGDGLVGMSQSLLDLDSALDYVERDPELSKMKVLLFGHSWGGYAVSTVSIMNHKPVAIACIAAYCSPLEVMMEQAYKYAGPFAYALYPSCVIYQKMIFGDYADIKAIDAINSSGNIPVFVAHGTEDETIAFHGASIISKSDKITNPNVKYYVSSNPNECHHGDIFLSERAAIYVLQQEEKWRVLEKKYGKKLIPDYEKKKYYQEMDKVLINELNAKMMKEVNLFFEKSLKESVSS